MGRNKISNSQRHSGNKAERSSNSKEAYSDKLPNFLIKAQGSADAGQIDQAISLLTDDAIELISHKEPLWIAAMYLLATLFRKKKQFDRAEDCCKQILERGEYCFVHSELGNIYNGAGKLTKAVEHTRKVLEAEPDDANVLMNLGCRLMAVGDIQQGFDFLQKATKKMPENQIIGIWYLQSLLYMPGITPRMLFDEYKQWAQIHAHPSLARKSHKNSPDPDRRLRIGYLSSDFHLHSIAFLFEPLLNGHNRQVAEVYGYGDIIAPDEITERLKSKFDYYTEIHGISDEAVADMIQADKIDILIELAGHSNKRLTVMAYKAAPIQVDYLGLNTTALQAIDYRFVDRFTNPPESQQIHTEELVYLPDGFICYRPSDFAPPVTPLPAERKGYITFGSFNINAKINSHVVQLWAQILKAIPESHLLMDFKSGQDPGVRNYFLNQFEQLQIDPQRVEISEWKPYAEHLERYEEVDILLDTFPFNGCITSCHALWMGVPVISLIGEYYVSRAGLSIFSRLGLEFFAASRPEEYVAKAVSLAAKPDALAKMRATMRDRMTTSSLCNGDLFAKNVEHAYRKMWHRWCQSRQNTDMK
ncbi:MAG: O-linked N-acetylglucosamine transferase, SPINDLY family protein [Planctomycetota bacterium]|jgi:predicted O-linked N-acetylglucosamine transferase (SPINDLY family)